MVKHPQGVKAFIVVVNENVHIIQIMIIFRCSCVCVCDIIFLKALMALSNIVELSINILCTFIVNVCVGFALNSSLHSINRYHSNVANTC